MEKKTYELTEIPEIEDNHPEMEIPRKKLIPIWLFKLPPGKYSLKQLTKISQRKKSSVVRTLKNLEIPKEFKPSLKNNFSEAIYNWNGIN